MALSHLTDPEQHLVASVALQEYSLGESAAMCKVSLRHAISNYGHALDSLGSEFVQVGILPRTNTFVAC
jgi:DNA-directed RNA polymerase specialized sigma24 family protein